MGGTSQHTLGGRPITKDWLKAFRKEGLHSTRQLNSLFSDNRDEAKSTGEM